MALEFAAGLAQAAREYGVAVIGGDTVASPGGLIITVTLTGRVPAAQMLRRAGAQIGDLIFVTGPLGEAAAGLEVLRRGLDLPPDLKEALTEAQLRPRPHLRAGRLLAQEGLATALIDTSDGVATDLYHICRASGVGAMHPRRRGPRLSPGDGRGPVSGPRPPGPGPHRRGRLSPAVHLPAVAGGAPARILLPGRAGGAPPPGPHRPRGPGLSFNPGGRGGYLRAKATTISALTSKARHSNMSAGGRFPPSPLRDAAAGGGNPALNRRETQRKVYGKYDCDSGNPSIEGLFHLPLLVLHVQRAVFPS